MPEQGQVWLRVQAVDFRLGPVGVPVLGCARPKVGRAGRNGSIENRREGFQEVRVVLGADKAAHEETLLFSLAQPLRLDL